MTPPGDATTACERCDGSVAHRHGTEGPSRVRAESRALAGWSGVRGGLLLVVAALVAVTAPDVAGWRVGLLLLAGAVAWALATGVGLLVAGSLHRPDRAGTAAPALALGGVAAAAAAPVLALAVVLLFPPAMPAPSPDAAWALSWPAAAWAGTGWLAATLAADVVAALRLRVLLRSPDRRGERARSAVARKPHHTRNLLGSVGAALAFATWVAGFGLLPALVVVAVPLHASVAARLAYGRMTTPGTSERATLRG